MESCWSLELWNYLFTTNLFWYHTWIIRIKYIDELSYQALDTIRSKKHKMPNEFSICDYLNANTDRDNDFIKNRIRYLLENWQSKKQVKNKINTYFKIYSTDRAILNDYGFSNKSNNHIKNGLTCTQSNKDLFEILKCKLVNKLKSQIKIFIK